MRERGSAVEDILSVTFIDFALLLLLQREETEKKPPFIMVANLSSTAMEVERGEEKNRSAKGGENRLI